MKLQRRQKRLLRSRRKLACAAASHAVVAEKLPQNSTCRKATYLQCQQKLLRQLQCWMGLLLRRAELRCAAAAIPVATQPCRGQLPDCCGVQLQNNRPQLALVQQLSVGA